MGSDDDNQPRAGGTASDYLVEPVHAVPLDARLSEIDRLLEAHDTSAVIVEDESGEPVGVVTRSDLLRAAPDSRREAAARVLALPHATARTVMARRIVSVSPEEPIASVAAKMAELGVHRVFVSRANVVLGLVGTTEIIRAVIDARIDVPLGEVMSRDVVTIEADEALALAARRIANARKQGLVVVEGGWPIGIISDVDVLIAQSWPAHVAVRDWMEPRVLCLPLGMPLFRAASHALHNAVRHVVAMDDEGMRGIVTGIDFARCLADSTGESERSTGASGRGATTSRARGGRKHGVA
jgi:CBS domain-containing protein